MIQLYHSARAHDRRARSKNEAPNASTLEAMIGVPEIEMTMPSYLLLHRVKYHPTQVNRYLTRYVNPMVCPPLQIHLPSSSPSQQVQHHNPDDVNDKGANLDHFISNHDG